MKNNAIYILLYIDLQYIHYTFTFIFQEMVKLNCTSQVDFSSFVCVVQVASATGNPLLGVLGDPTATATAVRVLASGRSVLDWAFYDAGLATGAVRPGGVTDVTTVM